MIGAIIGDIAGSRFEFNNHRSKDFELFHKDCHFTDDTVCTIATMKWVMWEKRHRNYRSNEYADLLIELCTKYPDLSYGKSFGQWLKSNDKTPYYSYGNGSAMRVSPVSFTSYRGDVLPLASLSASITHDHPEGIKGAQAVAWAGYLARTGASKQDIYNSMTSIFGYYLDYHCCQIQSTYTYNETCQQTVPQAIVAFLDSENFEDAIRNAISIGGDSDTLAAITGGIAEAFYGVPKKLFAKALKYLPEGLKEIVNTFYTYHNPKFSQYRYFSGEVESPFNASRMSYWWSWEKSHFEGKYEESFEEYIKGWFAKPDNTDLKGIEYRWQRYLDGD